VHAKGKLICTHSFSFQVIIYLWELKWLLQGCALQSYVEKALDDFGLASKIHVAKTAK